MKKRKSFSSISIYLRKISGKLKKDFPLSYVEQKIDSIEDWKVSSPQFFFESKEDLPIPLTRPHLKTLEKEVKKLKDSVFKVYTEKNDQHWIDLIKEENSSNNYESYILQARFSWVYPLIRYDFYTDEDQGNYIFDCIDNWIENTAINHGIYYLHEEEIALRALNLIFILFYYKDHEDLTEKRFHAIIKVLYSHLEHLRIRTKIKNESQLEYKVLIGTVALYVGGIMFPFFDHSFIYQEIGKQKFEENIDELINTEGAYVGCCINEHRNLLQLSSWVLFIADKNFKEISKSSKEKIEKGVDFLYQHQHIPTGKIALNEESEELLFPFNSCQISDFSPQLNALYFYFKRLSLYEQGMVSEDLFWFTGVTIVPTSQEKQLTKKYTESGNYILRVDQGTFVVIRCPSYQLQPKHADGLHIDIWLNDKNVFKRIIADKTAKTIEHNTVSIGEKDQMPQNKNQDWEKWIESDPAKMFEDREVIKFKGEINVYKQLAGQIFHEREVVIDKKNKKIEIFDKLEGIKLQSFQHWNIEAVHQELITISTVGKTNENIPVTVQESIQNGTNDKMIRLSYELDKGFIHTIIQDASS